jgi:hypothetical protein
MENKDLWIGGGLVAILGVGLTLLLKDGTAKPSDGSDSDAPGSDCPVQNGEEVAAECKSYLKYILNKWESQLMKTKWETSKYGVCKKWYPNEDIENMTLERAISIFTGHYFFKYNIDKVNCKIRFIVLDAAVNQGPTAAIQMLQACGGVTVDGKNGPKTQAASMNVTVEQYKAARWAKYNETTQERKDLFLAGWKNRLDDITQEQLKINKS